MDAKRLEFSLTAQSLGWEVLTGGWPDTLIYKMDGEKITQAIFVECKRGRTIAPHQLRTLAVLQKLGLDVRIWIGRGPDFKTGDDLFHPGSLLTLEKFLSGRYAFEPRQNAVKLGKQTLYNYRHQLKELRQILKVLDHSDPSYDEIYAKARSLAERTGEPVELILPPDMPPDNSLIEMERHFQELQDKQRKEDKPEDQR